MIRGRVVWRRNPWEILLAGSRSQHCWRVCALEPPWASTQRVWLWGWHLPVLTLPQSDRLRRDDPRGGHAGNLQARTLHLRRMGVWWPSLLAASRTPHVLPQVNWKATFPWWQVSSSYERYEERARIILEQLVAQVKHLQFYTEVFGLLGIHQKFGFSSEWLPWRTDNHDPDWEWVWKLWIWGPPQRQGDSIPENIFIVIPLLKAHLRFLKSVLRDEVGDRFLLL